MKKYDIYDLSIKPAIKPEMRGFYLDARKKCIALLGDGFGQYEEKQEHPYALYYCGRYESGIVHECFEYGHIGGPAQRRDKNGDALYDSEIYMEFNRADSIPELRELP